MLIALLVYTCASCAFAELPQAADEPAKIDFQRQVLPILNNKCLICHGPDEGTREAGLRLDLPESATAEADSGVVAIVPGDPKASELVRRITADESEIMPPADSGKSLSPEEIEVLTRWIKQGGAYEKHWAFEPVTRPELPEVNNEPWTYNAIDRFTLARMETAGLRPSAEAPRAKLARRMYFDLIGLPPTPAALEEFENDTSSDAVERLANKLFASPHYGERMAIGWLDGARYADTNGYQNDFARQMWPWRDWVIQAFNDNMPYDQFAIEQLAGDLLPKPTHEQIVATGFNRNNRTVTEAGSLPEEWLVENVVDRVETTSAVFLGLTMGCCRCHDHKYDPISQREFFEFFAFFNNITEQGVVVETRGNVAPMIPCPAPEQTTHLAELDAKIAELCKRLEQTEVLDEPRRQKWIELLASETTKTPAEAVARFPLAGNADGILRQGGQLAPSAGQKLSWTEGFPGPALHVDGVGVAYEGFESPRADAPFSASVWVRPSTMGALLSKMDSDANYRGVDFILLDGMKLSAHLVHYWPGNAIKVVARQGLPKDKWSHVALTYDGSSQAAGVRLYINGVAAEVDVESNSLSGSLDTAHPLRIGQRSNEFYFRGDISDVQLFDTEISPENVRQLLAQRLATALSEEFAKLGNAMRSELAAFCSAYFSSSGTDDDHVAMQQKIEALKEEKSEYEKQVPTVMVMEERKERRPTFVLERGEYHSPDKTQPVTPDVPGFLPPLPEGERNRLTLAKWIVNPENPLTARVTVNRLWAKFFGRGLVKTTENFGVQAELPSHPELLDWLAAELVSSGWDLQHLQRLIVTSATYRQASSAMSERRNLDPNNTLMARGPRLRLQAELIRDNALAISGLLCNDIGGPSVMPYQPEGLWEELAGGAHEDYVQDEGEKLYRRSLYVYRKRTVAHPTLSTFDAPSWEICQVKRETTNTPLQSLALLNDTTYVEAARKLAERMLNEGGDNAADRLAYAFRLSTGRFPNTAESSALQNSLAAYQVAYQENESAATEYLSHGESPIAVAAKPAELAAYAAVASVILNLDETVSKD